MKRNYILLFILAGLLLQTGCLYIARYDGTYHGKVVDQETREPIEGAVVLGTWGEYHFGLAGGFSSFYDAREAVTDKNGEFTIPGQGLCIMSSVGEMNALIYKSGYTYYKSGIWSVLREEKHNFKEVQWESDMPIFPLIKLTEEERKQFWLPSRPHGELVKMKLMTQEINKERIYRGFSPFTIAPERSGGAK